LLIDSTLALAEIAPPTYKSLLNEARELSELLIDVMHAKLKAKLLFGINLPTTENKTDNSL